MILNQILSHDIALEIVKFIGKPSAVEPRSYCLSAAALEKPEGAAAISLLNFVMLNYDCEHASNRVCWLNAIK